MTVQAVAAPTALPTHTPINSTPPIGTNVGTVSGGGGLHINVKKMLIFGAIGAAAGFFLPVIPGGPIGGAAIGAALACFL